MDRYVVRGVRRITRATAYLILTAICGCASAGNTLGLFPEHQDLIDSAKSIRQTSVAPLPRELEKRPMDAYIVEPGDGLLVLPAELDSPIRLPSDQTVLPDGTIDLGTFGRHRVAGRTVAEIEAFVNEVVKEKNKEKKDGTFINVRLVNRVSKVYYVLGEVNTPGAFTLQGRETVLDGIVAAGNLNSRASRKNIILVRPSHPEGCRTVLAICYPEIVQLGDTSTNYQLRPGDRIFVPTAGFFESWTQKKNPCVTCTGPHVPCDAIGGAILMNPAQPVEPISSVAPVSPGHGLSPAAPLSPGHGLSPAAPMVRSQK